MKSEAHAVVQLRRDNAAATLYNIVGFQTHLTFPEQRRILRMIPGLENAQFARYGVMHRNSFLNAPKVLDAVLPRQDNRASSSPASSRASRATSRASHPDSRPPCNMARAAARL
ncbi:MAG: FAD-dependent oxidoreductase [Candidatus Moduliflexus flocculans]|nr:FAD-dependent oxidoreductase [Candidatus Moduliflexus flocculans]